MALTHDEVMKIARLARLELSNEEVGRYATQLSAILGFVERLNALDVSAIEPTAHAVLVPTPYREDVTVTDATFEKSLTNAPDRDDSFFRVPKVIS